MVVAVKFGFLFCFVFCWGGGGECSLFAFVVVLFCLSWVFCLVFVCLFCVFCSSFRGGCMCCCFFPQLAT